MNNSTLTDEQLVVLVRDKDPELFREVIRRYQGKLLRYAEFMIGDQDQAADIVQDSLIKAFENLQGFNSHKKFSSWMYRIVHNRAVNVATRRKSHQHLDETLGITAGPDLEDELIIKELQHQTRSCLKQLSIKYRAPLSLYYLENKSYQEISDILRIPLSTVSTRIKRAKAIMKALCQKSLT